MKIAATSTTATTTTATTATPTSSTTKTSSTETAAIQVVDALSVFTRLAQVQLHYDERNTGKVVEEGKGGSTIDETPDTKTAGVGVTFVLADASLTNLTSADLQLVKEAVQQALLAAAPTLFAEANVDQVSLVQTGSTFQQLLLFKPGAPIDITAITSAINSAIKSGSLRLPPVASSNGGSVSVQIEGLAVDVAEATGGTRSAASVAETAASLAQFAQSASDLILGITQEAAERLVKTGAVEILLNSVDTIVTILNDPTHVEISNELEASGQQLTETIEEFMGRLVSRLILPTTNGTHTKQTAQPPELDGFTLDSAVPPSVRVHTDDAGLVAVAWSTATDPPAVHLGFDGLECAKTNLDTLSERLVRVLTDLGVAPASIVGDPEISCGNLRAKLSFANAYVATTVETHLANGDIQIANAYGIYYVATPVVNSVLADDESRESTITLKVENATAVITLPSETKTGPSAGVMVQYSQKANTTTVLFSTNGDGAAGQLSSPVVSVSLVMPNLEGLPAVLQSPVTIKLPVAAPSQQADAPKGQSPVCVWWDYALNGIGSWSKDGCSVTGEDSLFVTCSCSHMTHFAVLFSSDDADPHSAIEVVVLRYSMYIGTAVGLLGIVLIWGCFGKHRDLVDRPELFVLHLSVAIAVANTLFVAGTDRKEGQSDESCAAVAATTHYFLLTTWAWQLCEADHLYRTFVRVMGSQRPFGWYLLVGWGGPLLFVLPSFLGFRDDYGSDGNGTSTTPGLCLFAFRSNASYFFIVPALTGLIVCLAVGILILKSIEDNSEQMNAHARAKAILTFGTTLGLVQCSLSFACSLALNPC
jgi:hypothetical protein